MADTVDFPAILEISYADPNPSPLLEGLVLDLDASLIALGDGDHVAAWPDSSGSGNPASQGVGAAQPTYKTNIQNGLPVVRFDGGDELEIADSNVFSPVVGTQGMTVFVVARNDSAGSTMYFAAKGVDNYEWAIRATTTGYDLITWQDGGATHSQAAYTGGNDSGWHVFAGIIDYEVIHSLYRDGVLLATTTSFAGDMANTNDVVSIGRRGDDAGPLTGDVARVLVYNRGLSAAERQGVEQHLAATYGTGPSPWVDESAYLRRALIRRGRQTEQDQAETGTAAIVLRNDSKRFDPNNVDGPHFPNVIPMRRVRLMVEIDYGLESFTVRGTALRSGAVLRSGPVFVELFNGFVETWAQDWHENDAIANAPVEATDALVVLALKRFVETSIESELPGERITRVLDAADWPAADRNIEPGVVTLRGTPFVTENLDTFSLLHLQEVARSEGGLLFVSSDGLITFFDSNHASAPDGTDVFGDKVGERRYKDIVIEPSGRTIWNSVSVETEGETPGTASDATSILHFFQRDLAYPSLLIEESERSARAAALIAQYAEPRQRVREIQPTGRTADEWRYILSRELFDGVRVRRRPRGEGLIEQDLRIEGIVIDADQETGWSVAWNLSPIAAAFLSRTFYLGQTTSDLSGGADWNKYLEDVAESEGTITFAIAIAGTETQRAFTRANAIPTTATSTASYYVSADIANLTGVSAFDEVRVLFQLHRTNAAGTVQASSALVAGGTFGTDTVPVVIEQLVTADLGTFTLGDRLRVDYVFEHSRIVSGTPSITVGTGTVDAEVITPIA